MFDLIFMFHPFEVRSFVVFLLVVYVDYKGLLRTALLTEIFCYKPVNVLILASILPAYSNARVTLC